MGTQQFPFILGKDAELRLPAPLTIVASPEHIRRVRLMPDADLLESATLVELSLNEPIPPEVVEGAGILVVEMDPLFPVSTDRLGQARRLRPDLVQIAALANADLGVVKTLLRQGVSDVVSLPLNAEEVLQAAVNCNTSAQPASAPEPDKAPLIAVVRAVGGSGATTVATHLARELAQHDPVKGTCLIDLDIQYGSVASVLGLKPKRSISDLLESEDRLDGDILRSVAIDHGGGLAVIAAPEQILPLESVDADELLRIIDLARKEYGHVVLDLPTNWTSWNLSAVVAADVIVMVVELTISSLYQARRRLDLFSSVGVDPNAVTIVVNRIEKKLFRSIGLDDVTRTLGRTVLGGIHLDADAVPTAQDQGLFVDEVQRKSRFVKDVAALGENLVARIEKGGKA